jgi:hypothetical protein
MDTLLVFIVCGTAGALWMKHKDRLPVVGLLLGGFLNIFGLAIIFFIKKQPDSSPVLTQRPEPIT